MLILALPPLPPLPPILVPSPIPLPPPSNICPSSPILAPHAYPTPWPLPLPVHRCSFRPAAGRQLPHVCGQLHACSCASPPAPTQPSLYSCPPRHTCTDPHNCTPPPNLCTSPNYCTAYLPAWSLLLPPPRRSFRPAVGHECMGNRTPAAAPALPHPDGLCEAVQGAVAAGGLQQPQLCQHDVGRGQVRSRHCTAEGWGEG